MPDQQEQTQSVDTGEIKGVYTISDIDKFNIAKIENAKTGFLMDLSNLPQEEAFDQLSDLISLMQTIIEKYFKEKEIQDFKVVIGKQKYNFYDLKDELDVEDDMDDMRKIAEYVFGIYNQFAKQIGVEIPTTRSWLKKETHGKNVLDNTKQRRKVL